MPIDLKIGKLVNRTVWQPDKNQIVIDQTLELTSAIRSKPERTPSN